MSVKPENSFRKWLHDEELKDPENLCPPPLDPQEAISFLSNYILGEDWYTATMGSTKQINTEIVHEILMKTSKEYRKEVDKERKAHKKGLL